MIRSKMSSRRSARLQAFQSENAVGARVRRLVLERLTAADVRSMLGVSPLATIDISRPQPTVERVTVTFLLSRIDVRNAVMGLNSAYTEDVQGTGLGVVFATMQQRVARLREVLQRIFNTPEFINLTPESLESNNFVSGSARLLFDRQIGAEDLFRDLRDNTVETQMLPVANLTKKALLDELKANLSAEYRTASAGLSGRVILKAITFEFIRSAGSLQGRGSAARSIATATKTWFIISPCTRTNCAFVAMAICKNFTRKNGEHLLTDGRAQTKAGAALKQHVLGQGSEPWREATLTTDVFIKCSDYLKRHIYVYNNVFHRILEVECTEPKGPAIELYLKNSHYCALVRRKLVSPEATAVLMADVSSIQYDAVTPRTIQLTKTDFREVPIVENDLGELDVSSILGTKGRRPSQSARAQAGPSTYRMAAYDLETYVEGGLQVPYALGVAWLDRQEKTNYLSWWGPSCVERFFDWLSGGQLDEYTLFGHNAGKFDVPLLFSQYLATERSEFNISGLTELNGRVISMRIQYEEYHMKLLDSFCFLPQSLDSLTKEFKVKHQKLTGSVDHEAINKTNVREWHDTVKPYLENDCIGLLEVMREYQSIVLSDFDIDIRDCCTAASLARTIYFTHYYRPQVAPLHKLKLEADLFIRAAYFGGRCEVFYRGQYTEPTWYYDFTSLYPYVMSKFPLPVGRPVSVYEPEDFERLGLVSDGVLKGFGFFEVDVVSVDTDQLPLHGFINDNRLVFPHFSTPTRMVLFSEEIKYGQKLGIYRYQFLRGYAFDQEAIMADCSRDLFRKKQEATTLGLKARAKAAKVTVNSSYGFWGLRRTNRTQIKLHRRESEKWVELLDANRLQSVGWFPNYILTRSLEDISTEYMQVSVAAAVTSWARMLLYKLLSSIRRRGYKLMYCDTDSVISTMPLSENLDILDELDVPHDCTELGGLKNELSDDVRSEPDPCIHSLVVVAPKFYAWRRNDLDIQSTKLKGFSQRRDKLKYEQFGLLMNRQIDVLSQDQTQFRVPVSGWVREDRPFEIEVHKVHKEFGIGEYKKGIVSDSGDILPLLLAIE